MQHQELFQLDFNIKNPSFIKRSVFFCEYIEAKTETTIKKKSLIFNGSEK